MIQDILALSAFGLAATAFGALVYSSKRMASLTSANIDLAKKIDSFQSEYSKLASEIETLEAHIRVSEELRQGLQAKLEDSVLKVKELLQSLEDQKRSSLFQEKAWLQDRKDLEASPKSSQESLVKASEKIQEPESRVPSRELASPHRPTAFAQKSPAHRESAQRKDSFRRSFAEVSNDQETQNRLPLTQTSQLFEPVEGSRRGLTLSSKTNSFSSQSSSKRNTGLEKTDSWRKSETSDQKVSIEKLIPQEKVGPLEKDHSSSQPYSLKIDQLNLIVKTLQGRKSILEERNQNWEVALRYLSEHVLRTKGENPAPSEIGPLVALALQTINKSLMMNEMFSTDLDDMSDLSKLSDLIHDDHGSLDPFRRETPAP